VRHLKGWKQNIFLSLAFLLIIHSWPFTVCHPSIIYHVLYPSIQLYFHACLLLGNCNCCQDDERYPILDGTRSHCWKRSQLVSPWISFVFINVYWKKQFCTSSVGIVLRIKNNIWSLWTKGLVIALCFHNKIYCIHLYS